MKANVLFCAAALCATSLYAADSTKDDVIAAAKNLGDQPNYSWKATTVVPESAQFKPGPMEGKTEKDGATYVSTSFGDNTFHTVLKGGKGATTSQEGTWESLDELEKQEGFGPFRAAMARNLKTPAVQVAELAKGTKELKKDGDTYSGELTDEAAKAQLTFGRRAGGDNAVRDAKGSVKFWLKDGALSKYELKIKGTRSFNGNDVEIDRTTTTEIKDVGTTKVSVPEEAKKKLS
jgi:hypothetical protein